MTDSNKVGDQHRPRTHTCAVAWCATCGTQSSKVEVNPWRTGRRFRCLNGSLDDFHVAAVMDSRLLCWLRFQAWLAMVAASRFHPRAFLFKRRPELYVPFLGAVLLLAYWLTPDRMRSVGAVLALAVLADALLFHTMVAFVTRHPRLGMRTVVFAVVAFVEIAAAFGVLYRALPERFFDAGIRTDFDALYFSLITLATVGYGDIHPVRDAGWAQTLVIAEVGVGLYFLAGLFATMVSWAGAVPALPTLEQLQAEWPWTPIAETAQQAAAPDGRKQS